MKKQRCEIIPFPKNPNNVNEVVEVPFDETNFMLPLFVHMCSHYGLPCEVTMDDDIGYVNLECSKEYYLKFLFPKFEILSMNLCDSFNDAYTKLIEKIPLLLQE